MSYSDKSIKYLKELRESGLDWGEVAELWNEQYEETIGKKTLNALRKLYKRYQDVEDLSDDLVIKNLQSTLTARKRASKLTKENKLILESEIFKKDFLEELNKLVLDQEFVIYEAPELKRKNKAKRTIVAHISDTHIGCKINRKEMGGINEFNPIIAARRFALYFKTLIQYKTHHRKESDLVIVLNGDIFAGVIHSLENGVLPMSSQFSVALRIFAQGLSLVSHHFSRIRVVGITGNHDRYMHKDNKGRQNDEKWDSFATNLYTSLREILKEHKNIEFIIPETPYALFEVQGHNFFATHGDTVINVGNPGKSINTESITKQVNNFNAGLKKNIDVIMAAHVHKPTFQTLDNGAELVINGTLSGTDPFAQSIGIASNTPVQQIFEVTENDKVGDMRFVRLGKADHDEELDDLIEMDEENY